jgi:hypothetical protein
MNVGTKTSNLHILILSLKHVQKSIMLVDKETIPVDDVRYVQQAILLRKRSPLKRKRSLLPCFRCRLILVYFQKPCSEKVQI